MVKATVILMILILWFFVIKLQLRFATVWLSESEALTSMDIQMFL